MKLTYAQVAQALCFSVVILGFVCFAFGLVHVPTGIEDAKFFYMLFGIITTILAVPVLVNSIQKDDGFSVTTATATVETTTDKEIKNEETAVDTTVAPES